MSREVRRLAEMLGSLQRQVASLSAPRLARSAIVDGAVDQVKTVDTGELDELGNPVFREEVVSRYGQQVDGSNTMVVFDGPQPPRPVAPHVTGGPGFLSVEWSGEFEDRTTAYDDHDYVAVHVTDSAGAPLGAATLVASIRSLAGETVVVPTQPGTWFVSLVAVSQAGIWSEPAPYSAGEPGEATGVDVTAREMAAAAQAAAAEAGTRAVQAARGADESRALAAAVSAAANLADSRAIAAQLTADVVLTSADGKTKITYSRNPPSGAPGGTGDTWFQVDAAGGVVGFWECTSGDGGSVVPAPVETTPTPPTFDTAAGTVTIPSQAGVTYLLAGQPATAGTYEREGAVAVVAAATAGHRLTGTTAWVDTLTGDDDAPTLVEVTPQAPTATDAPGGAGDTLTIPAQDGVSYWLAGAEVTGTVPGVGTMRVTATARPGFILAAGAAAEWTFVFTTTRTVVTPPAPTMQDRNGPDDDTVWLREAEGVAWRLNGVPVAADMHLVTGTAEVEAAPASDGYAFPAGATTTWSFTPDPGWYATPDAPTFGASTYTIPMQEGVQYQIDGVTVAAGTYQVSSALVSTAFAGSDGAAWPAPWVRGWGRTDQCQATIRANQGQMHTAGTGSWSDKLWMHTGTPRADLDITYEVTCEGSQETWHHLILRSQQPTSEPSDGYDVLFGRDNVRLMRVVNWSSTTVGQSSTAGMAMGVKYRVRAQADGIHLRVKLWPAAQSEPSAWLIDVTDTQYATGHYGFLMVGGSSAAGHTHLLDNVTVTAAGAGTTVTVKAVPAPGWTLTGQTTWSRTYGG